MALYIDPGTGSMLFTILIGLLGAGLYFVRNLFIKLKYFGAGDKKTLLENDKIPIVVFSDDKRYWKIFEPILDELDKRELKVVYMTQSSDDPVFDSSYKNIEKQYIGEGNKAYVKLNNLNANIVFSTTPGLDVLQWKRSRNVDFYLHIAHGSNDYTTYRMFALDYYDAVFLSGEFQEKQIRELEKMRNLPQKELEFIGLPFYDEMKKKVNENNIHRKKQNTKKTVLVAPSWGKSGLLNKYGENILDCLINTGYKIIVRPHPQSFTAEKEMLDRLMKKYPDSENFVWNTDNDNFDVLCVSDILISDFSGILFEYTLIFDKPIIFLNYEYDKSPYDCAWLDEEMWTFSILPYLGKELTKDDLPNIKQMIDECLKDDKYTKGREKAKSEAWLYQGEGAKRAADYIERKLAEIRGKEA